MEKYPHLKLPLFQGNVERQKRGGGGGFSFPEGRNKSTFTEQSQAKSVSLTHSFSQLKQLFSGRINPSLIFQVEINQSVSPDAFEQTLLSMGIHILSIAEGKKGFWVVFSEDEDLNRFRRKLTTYGSEKGPNYDFFNAIETFGDVPIEKKIGERLTNFPLENESDFIDLELWRLEDSSKNIDFINQLKGCYSDSSQFRITDQLITNSFVLLRVKLTKNIFDEIIQLKEIARADRPALVEFKPFEITRPDISEISFNSPPENSTGILVIDSGIVSNHPMLEQCVGSEENFQDRESQLQDTVGHGTGVAGQCR